MIKKTVTDGNSVSYHIQVFGPKPYHGWVIEHMMQPYLGFEKFHRKMRVHIESTRPDKQEQIIASYSIPQSLIAPFNMAIAEADEAAKLNEQKRLQDITYQYYSIKYQKFCV